MEKEKESSLIYLGVWILKSHECSKLQLGVLLDSFKQNSTQMQNEFPKNRTEVKSFYLNKWFNKVARVETSLDLQCLKSLILPSILIEELSIANLKNETFLNRI